MKKFSTALLFLLYLTNSVSAQSCISIDSSPFDVTVCTGTDAGFSVSASGSVLSYQWQVNDGSGFTDISGATDPSLTVSSPSAGMNGYSYQCNVSGDCGDVLTSLSATLYVDSPPDAGTLSGPSMVCMTDPTAIISTTGDTGGTWSVDGMYASITGDGDGTATFTTTSTDPTAVYYTVTNACGTAIAEFDLGVSYPPYAMLYAPAPMCVGDNTWIFGEMDPGGTWSSSNPGIVDVDMYGDITAYSVGTATISYTLSNPCGDLTATVDVTVNPTPYVSDVYAVGATEICGGSTTTYAYDGTDGGTWSSDDEYVATVDGSGNVYGSMGYGPADITYTVSNSCGTASNSLRRPGHHYV